MPRNWMAQADADDGGRQARLTTAEKKELIELRRLLGVSRSGYDEWNNRPPSARDEDNEWPLKQITKNPDPPEIRHCKNRSAS